MELLSRCEFTDWCRFANLIYNTACTPQKEAFALAYFG